MDYNEQDQHDPSYDWGANAYTNRMTEFIGAERAELEIERRESEQAQRREREWENDFEERLRAKRKVESDAQTEAERRARQEAIVEGARRGHERTSWEVRDLFGMMRHYEVIDDYETAGRFLEELQRRIPANAARLPNDFAERVEDISRLAGAGYMRAKHALQREFLEREARRFRYLPRELDHNDVSAAISAQPRERVGDTLYLERTAQRRTELEQELRVPTDENPIPSRLVWEEEASVPGRTQRNVQQKNARLASLLKRGF